MKSEIKKGKVHAINISHEKGTIKEAVDNCKVSNYGLLGDAHAGPWHRQVSLLSKESINKFSKKSGRPIAPGEFAENITLSGIDLTNVRVLDQFFSKNVRLEVTQLGKKCHGEQCAIFKEVGDCAMPKEGIFCKVLKSGELQSGEPLYYRPKLFRVQIITLSDRASMGEYGDKSGEAILHEMENYLNDKFKYYQVQKVVIPDNPKDLHRVVNLALDDEADLIITTGGTGLGERDITPDVISKIIDKEIPGIMEHIRVKYGAKNPNALLSRSLAGIRKKTLIFTLPGSTRAAKEYLDEIFHILYHAVMMMHGVDMH